MRATTLFLASAAVLAMGTQAQIKGQIAALDSADSYCFFLPPMVGGDIAANEDRAIAFCNKPNPRAPGAKIFPPGFVLSAHWATGPNWIQITGQIDPAQYSLNPCDTGGQYDIKAPVGATCVGYNHFVNVIEPELGVYGMRCCKEKQDCDVYHSTYGVKRVYGAQYDFSGPRPDGPMPLSLKCVNGALPDGIPIPGPSSSNNAGSNSTNTTATTTAVAGAGAGAGTSTGTAATKKTSAPASVDNGSDSSKLSADGKNAPSSASGNSIMMATTAILATAVGMLMA
ncbi:hypothetical protein BX616_010674 [Lobosporangium transversale]|uniref:Uncharacterized protein n=1 Tax=Lobosporangium transversale TaxID=64571 RepID=A0A1Y2GTR0_9FUNG|nr:hypothetical protein BCR41DRAFT_350817 [Lobosporangium transversale]KAF9911083.1 hypothetical protein BX616_010674 [Lobosporangium transversale]ORZ20992.1 hypothetical protein BCR41DRAFT_350817 [Lobosporangium transversale]|eukprot:XP_021882901.1 hypothetical protein BCR41DRAFT_350817 [Lobosporangium transversale]